MAGVDSGPRKPSPQAWIVLGMTVLACLALLVWGCAHPGFAERTRGYAGLALFIGCLFLLPLLLYAALACTVWRLAKPVLVWGLSGAVLGLWFSVLLVGVPYIGLYPNLPVLPIGLLLGKGGWSDPGFYIGMSLANLVVWPSFVLLWRRVFGNSLGSGSR